MKKPPRVRDIADRSFGHWTAVRFDHSKAGAHYWLFRCSCGAERVRCARPIVAGLSKSCGCRVGEHIAGAKRQPRIVVTEKRCSACQLVKPASAFSPHDKRPDGLRYRCKECHAAYCRTRRLDPAKAAGERESCRRWRSKLSSRAAILWKQYGITLDDYLARRSAQGGRCAICSAEPQGEFSLCVDHDHTTGEIRGLLCLHCNKGLGLFGDSLDGLMRAVSYLRVATRCSTPDRSTPGHQSPETP